MFRLTVILLLTTIISLSSAMEASAQRAFEFDVYTIFASNYRHGMGDDLLLAKHALKRLPFSTFALLDKYEYKPVLGQTVTIPVPGGSELNIAPKAFYEKKAFIQAWITGNDAGHSFYNPQNSVSILSGSAFKVKQGDDICLIGPSTRWGTLVFVIHADVEGLKRPPGK